MSRCPSPAMPIGMSYHDSLVVRREKIVRLRLFGGCEDQCERGGSSHTHACGGELREKTILGGAVIVSGVFAGRFSFLGAP